MKKIVLAGLMAAAAGGAFAQVYVGGAYGVTQVSADCEGAASCDKTDAGLKFYAGYEFNRNWAVELGYIDFGKLKASGPVATAFGAADVSLELKVNAITLAGVGRLDFSPEFTGLIRLGIANVKTEGSTSATLLGVTQSDSASETKVKPYLGVGLEYAFTKSLRGTVGADFTKGELQGETGSVRSFNLGVQYNF